MVSYSATTAFAPSRTADVRTFADHGFVSHYDEPRLTHVYQIRNLVNGKSYIGITSKPIRERLWKHRSRANLMKPGRLLSAMRKHGTDMFRISAIAACLSVRAAMEEEKRLIALWSPEYNMTTGGEGVWGFKFSNEVRSRMSVSAKARVNRPPCPEWVKDLNRHMRHAERGVRKWPDAIRPKMLEVVKRANAARRRPVICLETEETFDSVTDAARKFGITTGMISHSIKVAWRIHGKWTFDRPAVAR